MILAHRAPVTPWYLWKDPTTPLPRVLATSLSESGLRSGASDTPSTLRGLRVFTVVRGPGTLARGRRGSVLFATALIVVPPTLKLGPAVRYEEWRILSLVVRVSPLPKLVT